MANKTRMKVLSILLLLVFMIPVLPPSVAQAAGNLNWGTVMRDESRVCSGLTFTVSSPGTAQVRFRTEQMSIIIFGKDSYGQTVSGTATFTTQDLEAKGFYGGGSGTQDIVFTVGEIAQKSGLDADQVRQVADTGGFTLGAVLGIYNGTNRIAEITRADQVDTVCGPNNPTCGYTFPEASRDDMKSRFGVAFDPQRPPEKPNLIAAIDVLNSSGSIVKCLESGKHYTIRGSFTNASTNNQYDGTYTGR